MNEIFLRFATSLDAEAIFKLVQDLAKYEKLTHEVISTSEDFREVLADPHSKVEVLLAEDGPHAIGFALFFENYSTFQGKPGLFLEDLFVVPEYRHFGVGTALLNRLIQVARDRHYGRIEWHVLDWNEPAIEFYTKKIGAELIASWRVCRITISDPASHPES